MVSLARDRSTTILLGLLGVVILSSAVAVGSTVVLSPPPALGAALLAEEFHEGEGYQCEGTTAEEYCDCEALAVHHGKTCDQCTVKLTQSVLRRTKRTGTGPA